MDNVSIKSFLGERAEYDQHGGGYIWGVHTNGKTQMIAEVRGYGAIQNLYIQKNGTVDFKGADSFQDMVGNFIAEAISEKLQREGA